MNTTSNQQQLLLLLPDLLLKLHLQKKLSLTTLSFLRTLVLKKLLLLRLLKTLLVLVLVKQKQSLTVHLLLLRKKFQLKKLKLLKRHSKKLALQSSLTNFYSAVC